MLGVTEKSEFELHVNAFVGAGKGPIKMYSNDTEPDHQSIPYDRMLSYVYNGLRMEHNAVADRHSSQHRPTLAYRVHAYERHTLSEGLL